MYLPLPASMALLARVFPILRRVPGVAVDASAEAAIEPHVLRAQLFATLRDLFTLIASRRQVILVIDDLQWADADSFALIEALVAAPSAPPLLLVGTARSANGTADRIGASARCIDLRGLREDDARMLARRILCDSSDVAADMIAREAHGHPLFVAELARSRSALRSTAVSVPRLEDVLHERVERLDTAERSFLEVLALCGVPTPTSVVAVASGLDASASAVVVARLRAEHLITSSAHGPSHLVETYHDRVRNVVVGSLVAGNLCDAHRRIVHALLDAGYTEPELLAVHHAGAGDIPTALDLTLTAAARATNALAFDQAIRLYRRALEYADRVGTSTTAIQGKLGESFANAGRSAEAAQAYLAAACASPDAAADENLEWRRRAAEQFLRAGHVDEAMASYRVVLDAAGVRVPRGPKEALAALLLRRAQLHVRGLGSRERRADDVPLAERSRIDTCWMAGVGLGLVDTITGSYLQTRGLLFALGAGEPARVARALAAEACFSAAEGGRSRARTAKLLAHADARARSLDDPYVHAWQAAARGITAVLEGRWRDGYEECERADALFRHSCTGASWESSTVRWASMEALAYLGDLHELARRVEERTLEARGRGDLYTEVANVTGLQNMAWLAADDVDTARSRLEDVMGRWSQRKFHVEHWWAMHALAQADIYAGAGRRALEGIDAQWPALKGSMLLICQLTELEARFVRARAALAAGIADIAVSEARAIRKQRMPWADALASLILSGVHQGRGEEERALDAINAAILGLGDAEMSLFHAAASARRGEIIGGDEGRELRLRAERDLRARGVRRPEKMIGLLAARLEV
jgi:hypothetical protein